MQLRSKYVSLGGRHLHPSFYSGWIFYFIPYRHGFVVVLRLLLATQQPNPSAITTASLRRVDGRPFTFVRRILLGMCGIQALSYRIVAIYTAFSLLPT